MQEPISPLRYFFHQIGQLFNLNTALDEITPEIYPAPCLVNQHLPEKDQAFSWTKQIHSDQELYRVVAHLMHYFT